MRESVESYIGKKVHSITYVSEPYSKFYSGRTRRFIDGVCDCGTKISLSFIPYGKDHIQSCGCAKLIFKDRVKTAKMRSSFRAMHRRCNDENGLHYQYYKSKGVIVWGGWSKFPNFYRDMESTWFLGSQLDRHPNRKGNYEPGNVRWATPAQQQRNKDGVLSEDDVMFIRRSKLSQKELSEIFGVRDSCISRIINHKRWKIK